MAALTDPGLIREKITKVPWFHAFEVAPGIVTPGHIPVNGREHLDSLKIARDLAGKTALDVGTWDGYVAFELAARGARTTALDIQDPSRTGFNTAREILGADVEYVQAGVYDLPAAVQGRTFDIVMFLAVMNAIKNPIGGFEAVASVMHEGSLLYFEGESFHLYAEDMNGRGSKHPLVEGFAQMEVPVALCYPGQYKHGSNWFIPNLACIKVWLQIAGLEVVEIHRMMNRQQDPPNQRTVGIARKVRAGTMVEHPLV